MEIIRDLLDGWTAVFLYMAMLVIPVLLIAVVVFVLGSLYGFTSIIYFKIMAFLKGLRG